MIFIAYKLGASQCQELLVFDETRYSVVFEIADYEHELRIKKILNGGCSMVDQNVKKWLDWLDNSLKQHLIRVIQRYIYTNHIGYNDQSTINNLA